MIPIKTDAEIAAMRSAGALAAQVLDQLDGRIEPGVSTGDIDDWCTATIEQAGAIAAPLNYSPPGHDPYPKSICTSVNHQVCHGIPSHQRILKSGDIVNVDVTVVLDGYHGDCSRMFMVGETDEDAHRLCAVTRDCLYAGIAQVRAGARLGEVGRAIEQLAKGHGYSVVREYCGHGLGASFHEPPQVLHYAADDAGPVLKENMVFTIEPMINAGKRHVKVLADGWTVVTKDRRLSAQWEHTVRVTAAEPEILTLS